METNQDLHNATNVRFVFFIGSAKPGAPANYRMERMRLYLARNGVRQVDTSHERFLKMTAPVVPVPLADRASHPVVSEAVKRQHNAHMTCALRSIERETPLLDGETLERDDFTFLTEPFNDFPKRTVVLQRMTNYGELLYLFPGVTVDPAGRLLFQEPPTPRSTTARPMLSVRAEGITIASVTTYIAKGIADGMLSAVGGAIAGAVLDELFPPGVPNYFDEVYEEMKRIVGAELQQETIEQINGAINNIKRDLTTEYRPAKQDKDLNCLEDRQFLFTLLQKYETTFLSGPGGMLGILMAENHKKAGFGVFLLGAALHLALFQEMANIDPGNKGRDGVFRSPLESSYGRPGTGTVAINAVQYAEFAGKIWPQIRADREAKIHQNEGNLVLFVTDCGSSVGYYAWYRDDLSPGDESLPDFRLTAKDKKVNEVVLAEADKHGNNPAQTQLIQHYQTYTAQKVQELTTSLNNPDAIISAWRQLATTPIKVP
jgi:hypothetical protein